MKFLSAVYVVLFCLLIVAANNAAVPVWIEAFKAVPFGDAIGHFLLIGLLSLSANCLLNFRQARIGDLSLFWGAIVVWFLVTVEEFSQLAIEARTFSFLDLAGNYLGIFCFGHLISTFIHRQIRLSRGEAYH